MRKIILIGLAVFFLVGCGARHISKVEEKWGPPARIVKVNEHSIYYYEFQTWMGGTTGSGGLGGYSGQSYGIYGTNVVELTIDKDGFIIKKREYWKQPAN